VSVRRVEYLLELLVEADKVLKNTSERRETGVHRKKLLVNLDPFDVIKPVSGILHGLDFTGRS